MANKKLDKDPLGELALKNGATVSPQGPPGDWKETTGHNTNYGTITITQWHPGAYDRSLNITMGNLADVGRMIEILDKFHRDQCIYYGKTGKHIPLCLSIK